MHALFGVDLLHTAGDFGGYGGAATRRDVSAGIKQSLRPKVARRPGSGNFHHRTLRAKSQQEPAQQHQSTQASSKKAEPRSGLASAARVVVDLKRAEIAPRRCGSGRHGLTRNTIPSNSWFP